MKLINDKGKIFGLINIVDLIVLVVVIAIVGAVGYRAVSPKLNASPEGVDTAQGEQYCYVTVTAQQIVPEAVDMLKVGDKLVANNEFTDAEIVSVTSSPAAQVNVNSDGQSVLSQHPLWKDITVVVKEKIDPTSVILKVATQEVRVNYPFILKTQTVECNSKIRGIEFKSE